MQADYVQCPRFTKISACSFPWFNVVTPSPRRPSTDALTGRATVALNVGGMLVAAEREGMEHPM